MIDVYREVQRGGQVGGKPRNLYTGYRSKLPGWDEHWFTWTCRVVLKQNMGYIDPGEV